jgi:hypothetical protein
MNIILTTMGSSIGVGARLMENLKDRIVFDRIGFFVADSMSFKKFTTKKSFFTDQKVFILKEWELTKKGKNTKPDMKRIGEYEKIIGDPTLWNALLADRRIIFGKLCKVKQDYKPRFNRSELLGILETFLTEIDKFLERTMPDIILGFGTATLGDYLFYLFAKAKKISYFQLKSTKVKNYVFLNDNAVQTSEYLKVLFHSNSRIERHIIKETRSFLDSIPRKGVQYEGAILSGRKKIRNRLLQSPYKIIRGALAGLRIWSDPVTRGDNHIPPPFLSSIYEGIIQPIRAMSAEKTLPFLRYEELKKNKPFLFYPLHFEPEVSLQVFGRAYQNQIEVVRNLALGVPASMLIIVKEHPRSLGFRKVSYYRKLLEIPNVRLVDPFLPAIEVVKQSEAVAVISGTIGFEAAVCKKPVIVMGKTPYTLLPESMVRQVISIERFGVEFRDLLENYKFERSAIERYVSTIIAESVPIDLYTTLFGKLGRFSQERHEATIEHKRKVDYNRLADYFIKRIQVGSNIF